MRIQKEIDNVERVKNRVATAPLTMEDAVEFHKQVVDRIEKDRKDINKELGIGDVEEDGFTGRTKNFKTSTPELKKMKLSESLFEPLNEDNENYERSLKEFVSRDYKGPGIYNIYYYNMYDKYPDDGVIEEVEIKSPDDLEYIIDEWIVHTYQEYYHYSEKIRELDESLKEELEDTDGWGDEIEAYIEEVFSKLENLIYEIRNCRRGVYTSCETAEELADYIHRLAEDLDECSYEIKANRDNINESFIEGGNTFTPVKTTILDKVDEGEDPLTYNEPWDEVRYINRLVSEVEEELDLVVEADTGTIQFTAEAGTGDSVTIDYSDLNEEEYRILAESSSEEEFKNNYRSFLLDLFENPFNESLNEDSLILPPEVQAQKDKEEKERQEQEKEAEFRRQTQREIERDEAREKAKEERDELREIEKEKKEKERQIKNQMWKEKDWVAEREKAGGFDKLDLAGYSQEEKDHLKKAFDEFDKDETAQARYKRQQQEKAAKDAEEARNKKVEKATNIIGKAGEMPSKLVNAAKKGLSGPGIHLNF